VSSESSPILTGYHNDFFSNASTMLKKIGVRYMSHTLVEQDQENRGTGRNTIPHGFVMDVVLLFPHEYDLDCRSRDCRQLIHMLECVQSVNLIKDSHRLLRVHNQ